MHSFTNRTRASLAPLFITAVCGGAAFSQERVPAPLPASIDIKTAPEPTRAPTLAPARPALPANAAAVLPQKPLEPSAAARGVDHSRMYYDMPGDGALWARGERYKTSFGTAGVTYYPAFGERQPNNAPHALSPDSVSVGGVPIAFEHSATAARTGDRVELNRGAFVEAYDLAPQSIEQTFVFASLPRTGDLVVHIPIASELEGRAAAEGLEFRGENGRVTYGRAVAIDADGQRHDAATELDNGSITIRVDADFLAHAAMPLVIDPVISTFTINSTTNQDYSADVSWDASTNHWLIVYEELYSSADRDIFAELRTIGGTLVASGYVDFTTDSWTEPHCANNNAADQFLVVAGVQSGSTQNVRGRTVGAAGLVMGSQFAITTTDLGPTILPDVGGDPYAGIGASYYCVAFERIYSSSDYDVLVRMVAPDGSLLGTGPNYLSNSGGTLDAVPSVSPSNDENNWMVTWQRHISSDANIFGAEVHWDGSTTIAPFQISTSSLLEVISNVSSPLHGTSKFVVAYQRNYTTDNDIMLALVDGSTVLSENDLNVSEGFNFLLDQIEPGVDSDGDHFLVSYSENFNGSATDYDIWASDLYVVGGTSLGLAQTHMNLAFSATQERRSRIASLGAVDETDEVLKHRYVSAWDDNTIGGNGNIEAGVIECTLGGPKTPYCFGDGSGTSCPCGNASSTFGNAGCLNSFGTAGKLTVIGGSSVSSDTLVLHVTGISPTGTAPTFFQGTIQTNSGLGAVFGDGLRCASGSIVRLGTVPSSGGVSNFGFGIPGTPLVSVRGSIPSTGATRTYQVNYRNSAVFCTSATFNTTNGMSIVWTP